MKGLKLFFKGKEIPAFVSNGSLHVIVGQKVDNDGECKTTLNFSGLDKDKNRFIDWYQSELFVEDRIIIEVIDTVEIFKPIKTRAIETDSVVTEGKLKAYYGLKKELEEKGLI